MQLIPFASEMPYSSAELVPQGHIVREALGLWLDLVTAADTEPLLTQNSSQDGRAGSLLPQAPEDTASGAFPCLASMLMTSATLCHTTVPSAQAA